MHIELVGLPGAGKSTLVRQLCEENQEFESARGASSLTGVWCAVLHPKIAWYWLSVIRRESKTADTESLFRYKISLLGRTLAETYGARRSHARVVVDEGLAARTLSFFETKQTKESILEALRHTLAPHAYIVVTGVEPLFGRYRNSAQERASLGADYLARWEEVVRHNYALLVEALKERGVPCCVYDRTHDSLSDVEAYLQSL